MDGGKELNMQGCDLSNIVSQNVPEWQRLAWKRELTVEEAERMFSGPREVGALAIQRIKALQRYGVTFRLKLSSENLKKTALSSVKIFTWGCPKITISGSHSLPRCENPPSAYSEPVTRIRPTRYSKFSMKFRPRKNFGTRFSRH